VWGYARETVGREGKFCGTGWDRGERTVGNSDTGGGGGKEKTTRTDALCMKGFIGSQITR